MDNLNPHKIKSILNNIFFIFYIVIPSARGSAILKIGKYATINVITNIKIIYGTNFLTIGPMDFSPAIWLEIYKVPAKGGVTIPTAMFIIIKAPTATVLIPNDCVIGIIIGQVSKIMEVGSIKHPRINNSTLIAVSIINLLLKPFNTAL